MLRYNVHCYLAEKEVCPDPGSCRDAGGFQHVENDLHGKLPGRQPVGAEIVGDVHEHLVDGVDHHVLRRDVLEVNLINAGAVLHVVRHSRRRDEEVHGKGWVSLQPGEKVG